ncbi:MAG TPA: zinc ribbon domain-containing protein [Terracidiphilus sp.]|nr:zinc ribbon domain-containing protein [Terracidiphilus sp.]
MYCSGCGKALIPGQTFCPQCGRAAAAPVPAVPNLGFQLANYASRIKSLSIVWFIYGGLSLALGIAGLVFARAFFSGALGPWAHGPWGHMGQGPEMMLPFLLKFAWVFLVLRAALAFAAGWGLMERTSWGRIVAIVAAFFSVLKFPIGTALAIWTLVTLLGYRNSTLYEQL